MAKANEQAPVKQFTHRELLFIAAYVKTKNQSKAAIAAGYSERSASVHGTRLAADVRIKAEIERRIEALIDRYDAGAANIVRELASIAFSSVGDLIAIQDDGSAIVDLSTATKRQLSALGGIEVDEEFKNSDGETNARVVKTKLKHSLADKRQALMDLAKLQRLLPADRLEHSGSIEHRIVPEEHKIDIEAMGQDEREQLRRLLLRAGNVTDVEDES